MATLRVLVILALMLSSCGQDKTREEVRVTEGDASISSADDAATMQPPQVVPVPPKKPPTVTREDVERLRTSLMEDFSIENLCAIVKQYEPYMVVVIDFQVKGIREGMGMLTAAWNDIRGCTVMGLLETSSGPMTGYRDTKTSRTELRDDGIYCYLEVEMLLLEERKERIAKGDIAPDSYKNIPNGYSFEAFVPKKQFVDALIKTVFRELFFTEEQLRNDWLSGDTIVLDSVKTW